MSVPHLSNLKIERRAKGWAVICACCPYPIFYLQADLRSRHTNKHGKNSDVSFMSAEDHRRVADFLEELASKGGTIESSERAA